MRKKLKDCSIAELKRYCIKRKSMPSGCTRCKLFHKAEQWIDKYNGTIQRSSCYCNMCTTPDHYFKNIYYDKEKEELICASLNDIILDIPKEE